MYLDYSKLEFDQNGRPEVPELLLKTLGDRTIGTIPGVHNLKLNIKFSEPSEISFDVPARLDGRDNPLYTAVTGHKQIYTKHYGVYETMNPTEEADGIYKVKHVRGYSYEKMLEDKRFFLEEGTYNFWDPLSPADTILGRVLEAAPGWRVGHVSPALMGRYRTFDGYDNYLLSFLYGEAPKSFRCVFVFDTYEKTVNAYDADEERPMLPIYLDFDNLLKTASVEEMSEELVTALRPYGADGLNIREVNPTGSGWLYDLSHFIANGDIPEELAAKWGAWQRSVLNRQAHYRGLNELRSSATARLLAAQAALTDLRGQLETLTAQQSVTIQAQAMEKTDAGKAYQQQLLQEINQKISAKKAELSTQESTISAIQRELDPDEPGSYTAQIQAIVNELSPANTFTDEEYAELSRFFIEQDVAESTFVASDVDTAVSGSTSPLSGELVCVNGSSIEQVDMTGRTMYAISGGTFSVSGGQSLSGDIIRGTLETAADGSYVLSLYAGTVRAAGKTAPSATLTMSGTLAGFACDLADTMQEYATDAGERVELSVRTGSSLRFTAQSGAMYLTASVSDYQRYSVQMELYDHGVKLLGELATPTYEFSVESGNFLFAKEFAPFRDRLELGCGVYLNLGGGQTVKPYIIEFELSFEDESQFSLVFSNRFKRHDNVNTLRDMVESGYSASRSLDASKYIYNRTSEQATQVSRFMNGSLDAAKNTILGAANQSVVINGAGVHIGGDSKYQMRIVDSMIALTDDGWQTCKMGMGRFASPEIGDYFGINADILAGTAHIGQYLHLENPQVDANNNPTGVMQFKVDSTGAWLNNSTFVLQKDGGGKILLDPKYGIVAGAGDLFDTDGTTVLPSFIDEDGELVLDKLGMPKNANFFLDLRDGSAYFNANGTFGGDIYANNLYFNDGSGDVKTLIDQAAKKADLSGLDFIDLGGITLDGRTGNINFSGAGSITWGNSIPNKKRFAASTSGPWHDSMQSGDIYCCDWNYATNQWGTPYKFVGTDGANGRPGSDASVTFDNIKSALQKASGVSSAYLTMDELGAPEIYGGKIYGGQITGSSILGGAFYNDSGKARLELGDPLSGGSWGGLTLYGGQAGDRELFSIYDSDMDTVSLSGGGAHFMTVRNEYSDGAAVETKGTWDFSSSNVKGITAVFA